MNRIKILEILRKSGCVSHAIIFPDGTTIVHWNTQWKSSSIYLTEKDFRELQIENVSDKIASIKEKDVYI